MASQTSPGATKRPRPLSPHLQIYRPQITSVLSITHRATGVALAAGTVLLAAWIIAAAIGPEAYARVAGFAGSWFGQLLLFGWSVALFYHLLNGIRHLVWDTGRGFDLAIMEKSGKAVVAGTVALTALAVWLAAAPASLSLYFVVLPRGAAGGPAWCEVRDKILFVFVVILGDIVTQ